MTKKKQEYYVEGPGDGRWRNVIVYIAFIIGMLTLAYFCIEFTSGALTKNI